jgi:hypothetical protein
MKRRLSAVCLALLIGAAVHDPAFAQPVPSGGPGGDHAPGEYPTTVTAANVNNTLPPGTTLGGAGSDNIKTVIQSSGPIPWTSSRHNEGDIALSIGPRLPNDPSFYPPDAFVNSRAAGDEDNTTQAWRVNQNAGALLASVRHNGVNNGDTVTYLGNTGAVGITHGIAYFNQTGAAGRGYRLSDGVYSDGGAGTSDLQLGVAGFDDGKGEAVFSTAVAYFPYEQGWQGAWVNGGDNGAATLASGTPGLDASAVTWTSGIAQVNLPSVNSATDGMLFVAPTHDNNRTNIAAAFPNAGGWSVAVREDENADVSGASTLGAGDNQFQFLYVPYTASNLIGGHIAENGSAIHEEGGNQFTLIRTAAGAYQLTVFEADLTTKRTENDGMLILSVAGTIGDPALADRTYLSYEYDSANQQFVIESRQTTLGPPSENIFGDNLALTDTNFYFAWVDFEAGKTIGLAGIPGDFDSNQQVNGDDLTIWRDSFGVDSDGDADDDGDSDGNDFLVWQQNLGMGVPSVGAAASIPEPGAAFLMILGAAALAAVRKRLG